MTRRRLILLAGAGSAALLIGALGFEYLGGLTPCHLCILERLPHLAAVVIALLAVTALRRFLRSLAWLGVLTMLVSAGLGLYHTGVEQHWWLGPSTCTSGNISGLSADQLMSHIMNAPLVQCDQVQWTFLGLSMASWNGVISLGLAALWLACTLRPGRS